jgi:hypothetical protein
VVPSCLLLVSLFDFPWSLSLTYLCVQVGGGSVLHRGAKPGNHGAQRHSQGARGAVMCWCTGIWKLA